MQQACVKTRRKVVTKASIVIDEVEQQDGRLGNNVNGSLNQQNHELF